MLHPIDAEARVYTHTSYNNNNIIIIIIASSRCLPVHACTNINSSGSLFFNPSMYMCILLKFSTTNFYLDTCDCDPIKKNQPFSLVYVRNTV